MNKKVIVSIGKIKLNVDLERAEYLYGIEGIYYNKKTEENEAYIDIIDKKIPILLSEEIRFFIPAHKQEDFEFAKRNNLKITQVVAPYFYGQGEEKVRNDKQTQIRHSVIAVIKHNVENKYLCVDCKKRECKSFVLGGKEKGETLEETVLREVKEETGYVDVKITYHSPFKLINHFYAGYKGVNRYATLDIFFGEINSNKNIGISEEENDKHVVKWIDKDKLTNFITVNNNKFALDILLNGEKAYTGDGVMVNSNKFNGMISKKARQEIENMLSDK